MLNRWLRVSWKITHIQDHSQLDSEYPFLLSAGIPTQLDSEY